MRATHEDEPHQDTRALGKMAFVILKTFFNRVEKGGRIDIKQGLHHDMIQYIRSSGHYQADIFHIAGRERPPMISIPEYQEKFSRKPPSVGPS